MSLMGIAIGAQVLGTVLGFDSGQKAKRANQRAARLAQKRAVLSNVQARRRAAAQIRRQQAAVSARSIATGQAGSSAQRGAQSSLRSQGQQAFADSLHAQSLGFAIAGEQKSAQNHLNDQAGFGVATSLAASLGRIEQSKQGKNTPTTAETDAALKQARALNVQ